MAGPFDWSVKIVPSQDGKSFVFRPDVPPPPSGPTPTTLYAQAGDIVSWGNETGDDHVLTMSTKEVVTCAAHGSSTPQYVVIGKVNDVIAYSSSVNPLVQGTITITTY